MNNSSFKAKNRSLIVEEKIDALDYGFAVPEIDVLNAIKKIDKAWKNVNNVSI